MKASYSLALTALLSSSSAFAMQQDESSLMDDILTKLGSSETVDESKLIDWGVLPGPFVNPEQGFGIGVAAVGLYTPYDWQKGDPYSTVTVTSYGSTSGSYGLGLNNRTYLKNDKVRLLGEAWISHTPGYYWGIGSQAAENENNKVQYEGQRLQLSPKSPLKSRQILTPNLAGNGSHSVRSTVSMAIFSLQKLPMPPAVVS